MTPKEYNIVLLSWFSICCLIHGNIKKQILIKTLLSISIIFSLSVNFQHFENSLDIQRTIIILFAIIFFPYNFYFRNISPKLLIVIYIILVSFQIGIGLDINLFVNLRDIYYPHKLDGWNYGRLDQLKNLVDQRFGGIYRNPNMMGQYSVFLFALFILSLNINRKENTKIFLIISFFLLIPILLAGSRIAFGIFSIIIILLSSKLLRLKLIGSLVLATLILIAKDVNLSTYSRVLNFSQAFQDEHGSGSIKIENFFSYLNQINSSKEVLLGNIGIPHNYFFDSDYGEIFYSYGILGVFFILLFYSILLANVNKSDYFIFTIFGFSFAMSIIFSFKIYLLIMVLLSISYNNRNQ